MESQDQQAAGATFTISGEYTGQVYATGVGAAEAAAYAINNGFVDYGRGAQDTLEKLGRGECWKSHADARGIRIRRVT